MLDCQFKTIVAMGKNFIILGPGPRGLDRVVYWFVLCILSVGLFLSRKSVLQAKTCQNCHKNHFSMALLVFK